MHTIKRFVVINLLVWTFIFLALVLLWAVINRGANTAKNREYTYSELFDKVQAGLVYDATIQGDELKGHLKGSKDEFHTTLPADWSELDKAMLAAHVQFAVKEQSRNIPRQLLLQAGPIVLLLAAIVPPFWVIFRKTGFPPALSILMLIPVANLILLYVVAFSEWKTGTARKM
jgi:ATP-dependent Zn protease